MTTYKEIRGTHIKTVTTDPPAPVNGQMWYNSTTQVMKGLTANPVGSWASGGDLNQGKEQNTGISAGTQTAGIIFGGDNPTPGGTVNTETYNGTSWTEVNNMVNSRRAGAGYGTYTSAVSGGSFVGDSGESNKTETWNGSSWTEVANLNSTRAYTAGAGTANDEGIIFGGRLAPGTSSA